MEEKRTTAGEMKERIKKNENNARLRLVPVPRKYGLKMEVRMSRPWKQVATQSAGDRTIE